MITLRLTPKEYQELQNLNVTKFAKLLAGNGESINSLSKATGISRPTLTRMYYGNTQGIQFETLDALCKHFDMSVQDVMEMFLKPR